MIRKSISIALLLLLSLVLLVLAGSFFLLGTDYGFRFSTDKAQAWLPGLTLNNTSGNLQSGIKGEQISWQQEGLAVEVQGLESNWSSVCLLQYRYCLDKLSVETLKVKSRPTRRKPVTDSVPLQLPQIILPLPIEATEVSIDELVLDLSSDRPPLVIKDIQFKGAMSDSTLNIDWLLASYHNYSARVAGKVDLEGDYPLQATVDLTAAAVLDNESVQAQLQLDQSLKDLQLQGHVTGALNLNLGATLQTLDPKLPLSLEVNWSSIGWPLGNPTEVDTRDTRLSLNGDLDDYTLKLHGELSGTQIPETRLELQGKLNQQRLLLSRIDALSLGGYATGSAVMDWSNSVTWVADLLAREINPGIKWAGMNGELQVLIQANGTLDKGKWALELPKADVSGQFRNFPLQINTALQRSKDNIWQIDHLTLDNGPNTLTMQGSYGQELALDAELDFPAIHYLTPAVVGNMEATAAISGTLTEPSIELDASSSLLKIGTTLIRDLSLDGALKQAALQDSELSLKAKSLNANGQILRNLRLTGNGSRAAHGVSFFADGPSQSSARFKASGALDNAYNWLGKLQSSSVELPANTLVLAKPVALAWHQQQGRFSIDPHCWEMREASLCVQDTINAGADGQATLRLQNYPLQYLNPFLPATAQLSGKLNATTDLSWSPVEEQAFMVSLDSQIDNGTITVTDANLRQHSFEYQRLLLNAKADPYTVDANLDINSKAMGNGKVALTMNPRNAEQSIAGELALSGFNIGFMQAFMPEFDEVGGEINIDGMVTGSLTAPVFQGRVELLNTVLRAASLPLSIDSGNLSADINGVQAIVGGKLKSGDGDISIGGNVSWNKNIPIAFLTIEGESLSIVQNPIVESVVNPTVSIRFAPGKLSVSGNVGVASAVINIKELPEGTTSLSEDVVIVEEEITEEPLPDGPDLAVLLDLNVSLGEEVELSGYGIAAGLTGDFKVTQKSKEPPQLNGEITITEGLYKSYGQDLKIDNGQILFIGPIEQTTLNIDAIREIDAEERVAGLHLEGPIANPVATLFTNPADKSPESILSYIVLGRDLGAGNTASESSLLASAALALTLKQGKGITTGFAESLGIKDFALEADGSGDDTQVVVSGRLSSRLLLRYGRSVFNNEDTLFLRYDISKKLYLEAAQGLERAVDVFYSFSF